MDRKKGFTLIEILLVVVIIGIMLAVIVPRAWRANVDTKYGLIRQNGAELGSFAMQWVEDCIQSQDPQNSTAVAANYYASLSGSDGTPAETQLWIADTGENPWVSDTPPSVLGRIEPGSTDDAPESPVKALVPPEKAMTNPFNGLNVFVDGNYPDSVPVTGALASCMGARETDGWYYVALLFQGTDSTSTDTTSPEAFFAGQDSTSQGLRNGIFVARIQSL